MLFKKHPKISNKPVKTINSDKVKIGDIILVAGGMKVVMEVQEKYGYGESSKWTHVAGSIGGLDLVEGQIPRSRVCNLQKDYVDKGQEIMVLRKRGWEREKDRVKVALWWATMNNTPYDLPQLLNFIIGLTPFGKAYIYVHNLFNSHKRLICSELIINGFFKEGYNLFNKPAWDVLPADYDNTALFETVSDIWM